jgi:hypothetical protein
VTGRRVASCLTGCADRTLRMLDLRLRMVGLSEMLLRRHRRHRAMCARPRRHLPSKPAGGPAASNMHLIALREILARHKNHSRDCVLITRLNGHNSASSRDVAAPTCKVKRVDPSCHNSGQTSRTGPCRELRHRIGLHRSSVIPTPYARICGRHRSDVGSGGAWSRCSSPSASGHESSPDYPPERVGGFA